LPLIKRQGIKRKTIKRQGIAAKLKRQGHYAANDQNARH
jgi:hypothetical protein